MQKTSNIVLALLFAGTNAISLSQKSVPTLSGTSEVMSNPKYISTMTLSNWKLFTPAESL